MTHCLRAARMRRSVIHLYMRLACGISFPSLTCRGEGQLLQPPQELKRLTQYNIENEELSQAGMISILQGWECEGGGIGVRWLSDYHL